MKTANDFPNAENTMLKAISLFSEPKYKAMGYHNLGNWNLKSNKIASQNYYEKSIACDPENYKPHVGIGWLFMTVDKLEEAKNYSILSIKLINKSNIDIDTKNKALGNVMNNIALIYHKQFIGGDKSCKDLAEKYYKKSSELNVEAELMTECLELLQNGDDIKFIDIYNKILGISN
jgi:tetratricopeptide (TPR) repeat protein